MSLKPSRMLSPALQATILSIYPEQGKAWIDNFPQLLTTLQKDWGLESITPLCHLTYHFVASARHLNSEVILKCGVPSDAFHAEIMAIKHYAGQGCVQLHDENRALGCMLLEKCEPGSSLSLHQDDESAMRIAISVMQQLWRPWAADFPAPEIDQWFAGFARYQALGDKQLPHSLVTKAKAIFRELMQDQQERVLLHGDLHHDNILQAARAPWLAIDPKGIVGEPCYDLGAFIRNPKARLLQERHLTQFLQRRVNIASQIAGFDTQRIHGWAFSQAVLAAIWSIEDTGCCDKSFLLTAQALEKP